MGTHLRATERHVSYGITQCYLPPDTGEGAPPKPKPSRPVLDLPTLEGRMAEFTLGACYILRWFTCLQTVTHSGSSHLIATRPGVKLTTFQCHSPAS